MNNIPSNSLNNQQISTSKILENQASHKAEVNKTKKLFFGHLIVNKTNMTQKPSFIQKIVNFVKSFFGFNSPIQHQGYEIKDKSNLAQLVAKTKEIETTLQKMKTNVETNKNVWHANLPNRSLAIGSIYDKKMEPIEKEKVIKKTDILKNRLDLLDELKEVLSKEINYTEKMSISKEIFNRYKEKQSNDLGEHENINSFIDKLKYELELMPEDIISDISSETGAAETTDFTNKPTLDPLTYINSKYKNPKMT
jgi:hypothetical protein